MRLLTLLCVLLLVSGCSEQQPIQRGFKYLGEGVKDRFDRSTGDTARESQEGIAAVAESVAAPEVPEDTLLVPSVDDLRRDTDWYRFQEQPKQPLNLSLPSDWQWHDDALMTEHQTFPNVFKLSPYENRFSVSGRLHLDESEDADELPTLELLQGAELELIFRTR